MMKILATVAIVTALGMPVAASAEDASVGVTVGSDHGNMVDHVKRDHEHKNKPVVIVPEKKDHEKRMHNDDDDIVAPDEHQHRDSY
jgi:phosphopantothenoylcysteine synthetase/decarboxylase